MRRIAFSFILLTSFMMGGYFNGANAQAILRNDAFVTNDLKVFEVKGHVKSIKKHITTSDDEMIIWSEVSFKPDGTIDKINADYTRNDNAQIITIEGLDLSKAKRTLGSNWQSEFEGGLPMHEFMWQDGTLLSIQLGRGSDYEISGIPGADNNLSFLQITNVKDDSESDMIGQKDTYKYLEKDDKDNWLRRSSAWTGEEVRTIEYYDFEKELETLKERGSLTQIEKFIQRITHADEPYLYDAALEQWNKSASIICHNSKDLDNDIEAVISSRYASEDTKAELIRFWNEDIIEQLENSKNPTPIVDKIYSSSLATDVTRHNAKEIWNDYYYNLIKDNPKALKIADKIINNKYLKDDYKDLITAIVNSIELRPLLTEPKDFKLLYSKVDETCGGVPVFTERNKKDILERADRLKNNYCDQQISAAENEASESHYEDAVSHLVKVLEVSPNHEKAQTLRSEYEHTMLWDKISTFNATVDDMNEYFTNNPNSKYNARLQLIRDLLEHIDHKNTAPRKMYEKMLKGEELQADKVAKTVEKCRSKD